MAVFDILTLNLSTGRPTRTTSNTNTFDFLSIRLGGSALEIKESAVYVGNLDVGSARITALADPINAQDAVTKGWAGNNSANVALSNLSTTAVAVDLLPSADSTKSLGSLSNRWHKVFASHLDAGSSQLILNGTSVSASGVQIQNLAAGTAVGHAVVYQQAVVTSGVNPVTGNLSFSNTARITNLSDPIDDQDAATKIYCDNIRAGTSFKLSVESASDGENVLLVNAPATIGGYAFEEAGERVLIKDQTNAAENGIYLWNGLGVAMTRTTDANTWERLIGAVVYVTQGDLAGGKYVSTVIEGGTLGVDPVNWTVFSAANAIDGSGTSGYVTYWSDTHTLASEQYVAASRGGLAADVSAFTGVLKASGGVFSATTIDNLDVASDAAIEYSKLDLEKSIVDNDVADDAAIVYSKLDLEKSIVDDDVSDDAAIAYSKLALSNSIAEGDLTSGSVTVGKLGTVTDGITLDQLGAGSTLEIKAGGITNTHVSSSAAIAYSKLDLANSIQAGDLTAGSVTLSKLGTVTDGVTLDQLGAGSTLEIKAGGITNTHISSSAAIAYSKLNLANNILAGDLTAGSVTASKLGVITDGLTLDQTGAGSTLEIKLGGISNAQISATAAISYSKLNLSGAIGSGDLGANIVTNTKLAKMPAHTYKGNNTASTADAADITAAQLTADLSQFTSSAQGVVPGSGGGTSSFLRADGSWAVPSGTGLTSVAVTSANGFAGTSSGGNDPSLTISTTVTGLIKGNGTAISAASSGVDYAPATSGTSLLYGNGSGGFSNAIVGSGLAFSLGALTADVHSVNGATGAVTVDAISQLTGDVTAGPASGSQSKAATIANSAVTNAKMANMAANTIKGNNTAGSAAPSDLTATQVTAMLDTFTSSLKGLAPASGGGTSNYLRADGTWATPPNPGGTVTTLSVVSANGLAGTVANAGTTPAITLSTTVTGLLKGNGTAISAATSGTDYAPATSGTSILYGNGSGGFSSVSIGSGLSFSTGTLAVTAALTVVDQDFDTVSDQATFTVTQTFTSGSKIDIWNNGILMREGASNDYTRNTTTNQIIFNYSVTSGSWVRVRVFA